MTGWQTFAHRTRTALGIPKYVRAEVRLLSYAEANKLIMETNGAWTIAPEEDGNRAIGWVYLERLVPVEPR